MLTNLWSDVRYAVRGLRHNPGFTTAALLAIALGIGVNTGIFTIINAVALRPLPAPDAGELFTMHQTLVKVERPHSVSGVQGMFSTVEYERYRDENQTLAGLAAFAPFATATLGGETPSTVTGEMASCNYFDVLRRPPALGRGLAAEDCEPGAERVVVLSYDLWMNRLGGDAGILGRTVVLNRENFRVVGIAEEGFHGAEVFPSDFWAPITAQPILKPGLDLYASPRTSWLALVGRRGQGEALEQVRADLAVIRARIDQQEEGRETALLVKPATFLAFPELRDGLMNVATVVLAGFGLVLLIACANVANLLLARAAARQKEIAVRSSVGASRGRLVQQLLTESLLIALAGGAAGSLLAMYTAPSLLRLALPVLPVELNPLLYDAAPDPRVLSFALAVTVVTGVVFGLAPALHASKPDLQTALKQDSAGSGRRSIGWLRGGLVTVQVAVCMTLMIAAGLLMRGLYTAQTLEPGFRYDDIAVLTLDLEGAGYDPAAATDFHARLRERLEAMPGVEQVAQSTVTPLSGSHQSTAAWLPGAESGRPQLIEMNRVSPEFFSMLEIPILRGRTFTAAEMSEASPTVVIVTQQAAQTLWPGQDPLGKTIEFSAGAGQRAPAEVIGVARDTQVSEVAETASDYVYRPASPAWQQQALVLVRSQTGFDTLAQGIQAAVREMDPGLVVNLKPLENNLDLWRSISRLAATMAGTMGGLALLLASIGVYGVVSYAVSRRLREVGIRMVLGASTGEVRSLILTQAMRPVVIGAAIGVLGAAGISRILKSVLFGVSSVDPLAFAGAAGFLLAVAAMASLIPARRAMRVDPMTTLRYE